LVEPQPAYRPAAVSISVASPDIIFFDMWFPLPPRRRPRRY
jgi:hypothetical protein